ncbi:MAG: hypothetical protein II957_07415, partial [Treponema sp.]|nr:hypothetical protein [Treponema sp.]
MKYVNYLSNKNRIFHFRQGFARTFRSRKKGQWLEKNLSAPLLAAEKRFTAFETAMKQAVVGGFGAVVTAAAAAVKSAIPLGMELEQNLGGTEAVFGEYAESVQTLAETAYKNMGLSAS